jgi:hypothetical protein
MGRDGERFNNAGRTDDLIRQSAEAHGVTHCGVSNNALVPQEKRRQYAGAFFVQRALGWSDSS